MPGIIEFELFGDWGGQTMEKGFLMESMQLSFQGEAGGDRNEGVSDGGRGGERRQGREKLEDETISLPGECILR